VKCGYQNESSGDSNMEDMPMQAFTTPGMSCLLGTALALPVSVIAGNVPPAAVAVR